MASPDDRKLESGEPSVTTGGDDDDKIRFFMWHVPRSVSTVTAICLTQLPDMDVWHEPYSMANMNRFLDPEFMKDDPKMAPVREYFKRVYSEDPTDEDKAEMKNSVDNSCYTFRWVKEQLELPSKKKHLFIKDVPMALPSNDYKGLLPTGNFRHTFLIRHPNPTYLAWKKLMIRTVLAKSPDTPLDEVDIIKDVPCFRTLHFYEQMYDLWKYVKETGYGEPLVIDADDLLHNPTDILRKYCDGLGITWDDKYLNWNDALQPRKVWHGSYQVLKNFQYSFSSKKFDIKYANKGMDFESLTPDLQRCVQAAMPFYEEMRKARVTAD